MQRPDFEPKVDHQGNWDSTFTVSFAESKLFYGGVLRSAVSRVGELSVAAVRSVADILGSDSPTPVPAVVEANPLDHLPPPAAV